MNKVYLRLVLFSIQGMFGAFSGLLSPVHVKLLKGVRSLVIYEFSIVGRRAEVNAVAVILRQAAGERSPVFKLQGNQSGRFHHLRIANGDRRLTFPVALRTRNVFPRFLVAVIPVAVPTHDSV